MNQPLNHRQAKSALVAKRIYMEFRWELKKRDHTWAEVTEELDNAIRKCQDLIPDEKIRQECIKQFEQAKARLSEFDVNEKADMDKLTGDACVRCGKPFAVDQPKIWVYDGQYVCARCQ